MHSGYSREKIGTQLQQDWLQQAREVAQRVFSEDAQQLENLFQEVLNAIEKDETEKAIKTLVEKLQSKRQEIDKTKADEFVQPWTRSFKEITDSIPDQIELPQEEQRFIYSEEDSVYIKSGKWIKSTARSTGRAFNSVGNKIRSVFGGEHKSVQIWKHTIPLKQVVGLHILDLSGWIEKWKNELYKLEAEALLEADAWTLHSSGLIKFESKKEDVESEGKSEYENESVDFSAITPTRDDIRSFFTEALERVKALKENQTKELDRLLNEIANEIQEGFSKAGTFEIPDSEYSKSRVAQKEQGIEARFKKIEEPWGELSVALVNRVFLSMSFMYLHEQVKERVQGFSASFSEFFETALEEPGLELRDHLEKAIAIFDESEDRSVKEIKKLSAEHSDKLSNIIDQKMIAPLQKFMEDAMLSTKLDRFTAAIPEWTKDQPEKAVLVEKLDLTKFPPKFSFEKVDWQMLVQRVLNNQIAKEFIPKEIKPEQFLLEMIQGLQEISQIVFTNLEIADEVKKSDEEEPFEVAREGLERAKVKLDDLLIEIQEKHSGLETKLSDKRKAAFTKLAMLLEKQDVSDVRMAGAEYMAKETAVGWKTKIQVWWAVFSEKAELFGRFIWKKTKLYFQTVRKFLGFTEKENLEGDKTDLATFLSETDEQIAALPFIYRRLFDFKKEIDARFYIRKPEQFERFRKGYELWQNDFPSAFSIVGEKGSGKSLITQLLIVEIFIHNEVIEINFEDTLWKSEQLIEQISSTLKLEGIESIEDLIAAINRKKKRIIVILENVQNCYIRNISGFEAIEHLLLLISETNKNILWVASATRYGWLYLDKVLNVADYFTHAVETDNLTAEQVEELILKRHKASGYQLKFIADEATKKSRSFKKLMSSDQKTQEFLQEKYFEKLAKLAEGNSSIAMIFWIRSIKEYDETHFYINPFNFNTISRIDELDSMELFALAAFVLHDSLMPEELSEIMHQPLKNSQLMVSRLSSRSILYKTEHGYMLNQLIYRQVLRVLKEANFIH